MVSTMLRLCSVVDEHQNEGTSGLACALFMTRQNIFHQWFSRIFGFCWLPALTFSEFFANAHFWWAIPV